MKRFTLMIIGLLALATFLALPASAVSAGFHYANASGCGLNLCVGFKETGLGNAGFSSVNIAVAANASATYQCFNNGGNHPKAGNKTTVNGPVSGSGTFPVANGQTTGTITVLLPGPGNFSCPSGQTLELESGTFTNIEIEDLTLSDGPIPTTPDSVSVP